MFKSLKDMLNKLIFFKMYTKTTVIKLSKKFKNEDY